MKTEDDFDFPFPKRSSQQVNWTLPNAKKKNPFSSSVNESMEIGKNYTTTRATNRTDDIEGAAAATTEAYKIRKRFQNKPNLFPVDDIAGSQCQRLIPVSVRKPNDRNISNRDIEFSVADSHKKRFATNRVVNPLEPNYRLPTAKFSGKVRSNESVDAGESEACTATYRPPTPPRFFRDTLKVDDIEGTVAKSWVGSLPTVMRYRQRLSEKDKESASASASNNANAAADSRWGVAGRDTVGSIIFGKPKIVAGSRQRE